MTYIDLQYCGREIIINHRLTVEKETRRSWTERLLSWTPWRAFKTISVPDPDVHLSRNFILMHPQTYIQMEIGASAENQFQVER